ncbi:hypothetical protein [uncultured Gammaproteobacteria bacterium]|jgi:hypothetical protein|uniref:DUF6172 family protein n=1 Tax=thiotrophic endosymbiont of Bathymodiolus puteoserpentis (Logatchev) TaxID=343240 RepID=UPI0010B4434F|nr:DUF6172 family protein [thiotrophic endosymbiont of Bathymodiolus puteoserpentis (Logatchev)]CAC9494215.1 FIG00920191: hypothetical protein [uncultured Gammaproteobacteria bacterium]CAC9574154.1 hypothetical protein [uncultured Gammaproteobacteria bacterium]CAC9576042.1 hypothetical protein [uncultured Gammaproteobacteria bacterium]CAC9633258.1 hypothetical protein [uncultured Gammaproteobacteria bacterium]CAC9957069.1 hypothetical protein [uncultured Gammaproteobacteria bacterium]
MKKTFSFSHPKKQRPRVVEAIKYELKKYIKRERNKKLPDNVDFWDFDCRYGANEDSCSVIHVSEINKVISEADAEGLDSFFLEVLSKPSVRIKKPEEEKRQKTF